MCLDHRSSLVIRIATLCCEELTDRWKQKSELEAVRVDV